MTIVNRRAWIGIGANLGDPRKQVLEAIDYLELYDQITVEARSSLYRTAPIGKWDQPDFINAVVRVVTTLDPLSLLRCLSKIEYQFGRVRNGSRNSPRHLDLDLLLYANEILSSVELVLPHPRMQQRLFVLEPLMELEGDFVIPGKESLATCINACQGQRITKLVNHDGEFISGAN